MVTPEDTESVARTINLGNYPGKDVKGTGYLDDFSTSSDFFIVSASVHGQHITYPHIQLEKKELI